MLLIGSSRVAWDGVPSGGMLQSDCGLLSIPQNLVSVTSELQTLWGPPAPVLSLPTLQHPSMMLRHPVPAPSPSPPHFGGHDPSLCPLPPQQPPVGCSHQQPGPRLHHLLLLLPHRGLHLHRDGCRDPEAVGAILGLSVSGSGCSGVTLSSKGDTWLHPLSFPSDLLLTSSTGELWRMVRIGGQPLGFGESDRGGRVPSCATATQGVLWASAVPVCPHGSDPSPPLPPQTSVASWRRLQSRWQPPTSRPITSAPSTLIMPW